MFRIVMPSASKSNTGRSRKVHPDAADLRTGCGGEVTQTKAADIQNNNSGGTRSQGKLNIPIPRNANIDTNPQAAIAASSADAPDFQIPITLVNSAPSRSR